MSVESIWLESFTGVALATGEALPGVDIEADTQRFELKRAEQARKLEDVRRRLAVLRGEVQDEMGKKIKSGKLKGQQLLKELGTQTDEIEAEELKLEDLELSKESLDIIGRATTRVAAFSLELEEAEFTFAGKTEQLFSADELRAEYWTPLMRERLLPETYIPGIYSETQRMLDETNAAYLKRIEQEKAEGTLTPRLDRRKELMNGAFELVTLAGDMAGKFGAGSQDAKLAALVLNTSAAVLQKGNEILTNIGDGKYADASASAFDTMGTIAGAVLGGFGVDPKATTAVTKSFSAGSKAIMVGNAFAQGIDGAEEGLSLMGGVMQTALETAASLTDDPAAKTGLLAAKATVPALFKQAAIGMNLRQKIHDQDYAGIVECLSLSFKNVLGSVKELQSLNEMKDKSPTEQKKIQDRLDKEKAEIEKYGDLGAAGLTMAVKAALAARSGEYLAALNGVIDDVGAQLGVVLESAGIDPKQAQMIGQLYVAASSAPKALQKLASKDFDVAGALDDLGGGILIAFKQVAPDNVQLQQAGGGLVAGLKAIGSGINAKKQFDKGDYQGAMTTVIRALQTGVKSSLEVAKMTAGKEDKVVYEDVQKYIDMGEAGVEMAIKATVALKKGEYLGALSGVIEDIGGQLSAVLTKAGLPKAQADAIGQLYTAAASAPRALQRLTGKDFDVDGALTELAGGIRIAFAQAAPGNATLAKVGEGLASGIELLGAGAAAKKKFEQHDYSGAIETFTQGISNGVKSGLKVADLAPTGKDGDEPEDLMSSLQEEVEALKKQGDELSAQLEKAKEENQAKALALESIKSAMAGVDATALAGNLEQAEKEVQAAQKKAAADAARAEAEDLLAEAQADADGLSEAQRFGAEASSIDKLVAKLQRDRMVLELATQIAQGGAAFLAKFVPVLGAVAAGIKLAAQLHAAGLRAQQLHRWVRAQDDLEKAQSSLSSSAGNFVRNQAEQLAHYAAQALFAATQLAAEITKLSGVAAPIGMGLDAAATAGAKLEQVTRDYFRKEDLEHAWDVTAQALRSPNNRKLGLKARRLNPSLAKYSMAWGAHTLGDPLAKNALRACNLTEASFKDKDTDVDKVVYYLETFYSDDLKLYRELDEAPKWIPAELTLTLPSWTRLKRAAVAEGKLVDVETGRVDGALAELDVLSEGPGWETFKQFHAEWTKSQDKEPSGGLDDPQPDLTPLETALATLEVEVGSKKRLIAAVRQGLTGYAPTAAPGTKQEAAEASTKAIELAKKVLIDQAGILAKSADTEMQSVAELRRRLLPA